MPGCALMTFRNKLAIVVAGGEDSDGNKLKNVEILQFDGPDQYGKILDNLLSSTWQEIPKLNFARSGFPSVGIVEGLLTVTAGVVDSSNPVDQVSVEQFNENSESWIVRQDIRLKNPRHDHSTMIIPSNWCNPPSCKRNFQGRNCKECAEGFQGTTCDGIPSMCSFSNYSV